MAVYFFKIVSISFIGILLVCFIFQERRHYDCDNTEQLQDLSRRLYNLSLIANEMQEQHQQLICKTQNERGIGQTGGWCEASLKTGHMTDVPLARALADLFAKQSVIGLGDGLGIYRQLILNTTKVSQYDAFDGTATIFKITKGNVRFIDLTLPQYWMSEKYYDWVVCMEVIEHIPATHEDTVIDNIARVAGRDAIISWAAPKQGGFHHVNCQPDSYVEAAFEKRGLYRDNEQSANIRKAATIEHLKKNLYVYRRPDKRQSL